MDYHDPNDPNGTVAAIILIIIAVVLAFLGWAWWDRVSKESRASTEHLLDSAYIALYQPGCVVTKVVNRNGWYELYTENCDDAR